MLIAPMSVVAVMACVDEGLCGMLTAARPTCASAVTW